MSVTAMLRQLRRWPSSWRLGLLPFCRQTWNNCGCHRDDGRTV